MTDEEALRETLRAAKAGDKVALKAISELSSEETAVLAELLSTTDTAHLILKMRPKRARRFLAQLPAMPSLQVVETLDPTVADALVDDDIRVKLGKVVAKLPRTAAAEFMAEMPRDLARAIYDQLGRPAHLEAAFVHREDSAGAFMQRAFVVAQESDTIADVIPAVRAAADRMQRLYSIYVVDDEARLTGQLEAADLVLNDDLTAISSIAGPVRTVVNADMDREAVLREAEAEGLSVLPVVDEEGRLIGRITPDELRLMEREEAEEDRMRMSGLRPDSAPTDGPLQIVPRRLPWLAGGLIGSGIAAVVVGSYEDALTEAAILASMIPIVMSLAGNAGIQASTVTVQAQASGSFWIGDLIFRVFRELGGALLNGAAVGLIVATAILILAPIAEIERSGALALTALLTLISVTVQASVVGALVPVVLQKLGFDPAVATGVFITTSNDVVGVLLFFVIATTLYI